MAVTRADFAEPFIDSRLQVIIRLERFALAARYVAYFVLIGLYLAGPFAESINDLIIVTILVAFQNGFVHVVLWSKRYYLFRTPLNFLIYLLGTTFIIQFTGSEESEFFILYFFLLIGYTAYSRRYIMILIISGVFCLTYTSMIGVEWAMNGLMLGREIIMTKVLSIPLCGWLVATISELLREAEDDARAQTQALAASEAALRLILDSTADPILAYDDNEIVTEANNGAAAILRLERDQILGRPFRNFLFDDGNLADLMSEIYTKGDYHDEQLLIDADGQDRAVDLRVHSYVRDAKKMFVAVAHDISEQKQIQETAALANRHLNQLNRQLQQVNELKTGLLRSLSLRIRSPLTAVLGYFGLIRNYRP